MLLELLLLVVLLLPVLSQLVGGLWRQPRPQDAASQYDEYVPGCKDGPDRFYALVSERLQADLNESSLPFNRLSFGPRRLSTKRGLFRARSLYLEIRYLDFSYYVYAVPATGGLYVSNWLFAKSLQQAEHPVLKWLVWWRYNRMTLFQVDVTQLFHISVSSAVYTVLDEMRREQGLRPLEQYERRPILCGFYGAMRGGDRVAARGVPGSDGGLLPVAQQAIEHPPVTHLPVSHLPVTHSPITHSPVTHQPVVQNAVSHPDFDGIGSSPTL